MQEIVLKGTDISFKYGNSVVLDKCNFKVNNGDFSVIIGPNGSGKKHFIKDLSWFVKPSKWNN